MALKGYSSYRGRQGIWRRLLAIVLVLVLMAACGFLLLQRYITYSDDGSFYLDLPFELNLQFPQFQMGGNTEDEPPSDNSGQDMNLVVDNQQENEEEPDDAEEPPQEEVPQEQPVADTYIARRLVSLEQLLPNGTTILDGLAAAGADGFVFRAKDREGYIYYLSSEASENAIVSDALSRDMIAQLCAQEGVYTVARISCLRDPIFALAHINEASIRNQKGYAWFENAQGGHWLEPEKALTREYLIGLAVECAELGFDELLLEDVCYPSQGNLYKIVWEKEASKTEALFLLLSELKAAMEPYGVQISLVLDEETVRGLAANTEDTGFVVQQLLPMVDAVYVSTDDAETVRLDMEMLLTGESVPTLIPIVSEAPAEGGWYLVG